MFKKIMLTSIFTLTATSAFATPFNGFYAGADFGMSQAQFTKDQTVKLSATAGGTTIFDIPIDNQKKLVDNSLYGNIDAGFSKVFKQHFYLGLEANADFQSLDVSNNPALAENVSGFGLSLLSTADLKNEFAVTLNPGFIFHQNTLIYGKIGPAWGRFSTHGNAQYNQNLGGPIASASANFDDDSYYECGLRLGLGMEHYLTDHLSLKLEYVNTNYGTIHSGSPVDGAITTNPPGIGIEGNLTNSDKISARNNSVMLGLNYRFG